MYIARKILRVKWNQYIYTRQIFGESRSNEKVLYKNINLRLNKILILRSQVDEKHLIGDHETNFYLMDNRIELSHFLVSSLLILD